jgi:hypothetical protein
MLFQEFGQNISIEEAGRLGHQAAGSRKNCCRFSAMASTCATSSGVRP